MFLTPFHLIKGFSWHVQNLFYKKKSEGKNDLLLVLTGLIVTFIFWKIK